MRTYAGAQHLATNSKLGLQIAQSHPAFTRQYAYLGTPGAFTGTPGITTGFAGTNSTQTPASTNAATRTHRHALTTGSTAGAMASLYQSASPGIFLSAGSGNGGFHWTATVVPALAGPSGQRQFVGLSSSLAAPTNVEPSSLTNVIGFAQLSGSTNWQVVFGGSSAQTPIDLGSNYPANTASVDLYQFHIFSDPNDATQIFYRVIRNKGQFDTGDVAIANTTPGTTLPATSTALSWLRFWTTNNATAADSRLAVANIVVTFNT